MSVSLAAQSAITVAFLGPDGTYTHNAALKHFGHSVKCLSLPTIDEVFHAVEKRQAHYGVVPVENSTEGVVTHTLDMFFDSSLKICGEVLLRVRHQFLSNAASLDKVDKVLAHSQSLAQCRRWLTKNVPLVETIAVSSNAEAAEQASRHANIAAIASTTAAEIYGVKVLIADIEDDPDNTTRFLIIGNTEVEPSGDDKTSLLVSSQNKPGALYRLLAPMANHGVSMTRIESRPSRKGLWEYVFFIDFEGHAKESRVAEVLAELKKEAALVKLLGAYPRAIL
jgi:chorismate mutase/prephenate dehydratase